MLSRCVDFCAQRKMRYNGQAQRPVYNKHEAREQAGRGTPKAAQRGGRPTARPPDITGLIYLNGSPKGDPPRRGQTGSPKGGRRPTPPSPASARGRRSGGPPPSAAAQSRQQPAAGRPDQRQHTGTSASAPIKPPARGHVMLAPPIHGVRETLGASCAIRWRIYSDTLMPCSFACSFSSFADPFGNTTDSWS